MRSASSPLALTVNSKLSQAVADLRRFQPHLWVCNGDLSDHGYAEEHAAFKEIMATAAQRDRILVNTGNHEFYDREASDAEALARFRRAYGQTQVYSSHIFGGAHIVMLGDEQWKGAPHDPDWAWLSSAQLRWFDQVLARHREKPTAVFLHQPMPNTVRGSTGEGAIVAQAKELRGILEANPQVRLWFSGHTHYPLDLKGQIVTRGRVTYIALGSTFYLIRPAGNDTEASQSRLMEIYPDKVVVKARDHARRAWLTPVEATIDLL